MRFSSKQSPPYPRRLYGPRLLCVERLDYADECGCSPLRRGAESPRSTARGYPSLTGLQDYGPNGYRRSFPGVLRSQRRLPGFAHLRPRGDWRRSRLSWFKLASDPINERLPVCRHLEKRAAVRFVGRVLRQLQAFSGVVLIFRDAVHVIKSTRRNAECSLAVHKMRGGAKCPRPWPPRPAPGPSA